jgi:hypothetical protein
LYRSSALAAEMRHFPDWRACKWNVNASYCPGVEEDNDVNSYEHLVGEHFTRNGVRYTVIKCVGATVVAAYLRDNRVHRVLARLSDVLDALEVTEINMTTPVVDAAPAPRRAI